jgi:hypothetical protein
MSGFISVLPSKILMAVLDRTRKYFRFLNIRMLSSVLYSPAQSYFKSSPRYYALQLHPMETQQVER